MDVPRYLTGALVAPLLLLAACGGDDTSIADPPISPGSPSSSPTTPQRESPEHFIRRWFAEGTAMQNTGDVQTYLAMQRACRDCMAVASRVKRAYARGGFYKTKGVRTLRITSSRKHTLDVTVDLFPTTYATSATAPSEHFDGGPEHFQVRLTPSANSWLVASFVQVTS